MKLGVENFFFKIPCCRTFLKFSIKTSVFFFRLKRIPFFFDYEIFETLICFRGVFNLNCYISKKVQKKFLMGLKIWGSWGSRSFFFFRIPIGRTVFSFSCKTSSFKKNPYCFGGRDFFSSKSP